MIVSTCLMDATQQESAPGRLVCLHNLFIRVHMQGYSRITTALGIALATVVGDHRSRLWMIGLMMMAWGSDSRA